MRFFQRARIPQLKDRLDVRCSLLELLKRGHTLQPRYQDECCGREESQYGDQNPAKATTRYAFPPQIAVAFREIGFEKNLHRVVPSRFRRLVKYSKVSA